MSDLKSLGAHYEFGENWASFSNTIDEQSLQHAEQGILALANKDELAARTFLDIGCGSGIHSAAAGRLGVKSVLSTDIDPKCIATTARMLERFAGGVSWKTENVSVFDISPQGRGTFDVVYSWGVLHHTGAMHEAIERAAAMVSPGGLFVFALYRRTSAVMDRLWTLEKRWYTRATPIAKKRADATYNSLMKMRYLLAGRSHRQSVATYKSQRGNSYAHDISDWLGGYPYEVIAPQEVETLMTSLGFEHVRSIVKPRSIGLFGSGCDQYTYRRKTSPVASP